MGERLRESEATIRALLEATPDSAALIERDGTIILVNREFAGCLGKDPGELVGVNVFDLPSPELAASRRRGIDEVVRTGRPHTFVDERSGKVFENSVYPVAGVEGKVDRVAIFARDLTEQLQAEAAMRESEERYRLLLEKAGAGIGLYDLDGRVVLFNRQALEHMGGRQEDYAGKSVFELYGPDLGQVILDRIREAGGSEGSTHFEDEVELFAGRRWFSSSYSPMIDARGTCVGVQIISTDVTGLKRAEEEAQKLASIVRHSGELVNLADPEGRMIFLNQAGGRMLGLDPDKIEGISVLEAIPEHLRDLAREELLGSLRESGAWEGELQYRNLRTGELTEVYASAFTITDPASGEIVYLANVSRDITEQKRAERALKESEFKLRRITDNMLDMVGQTDAGGIFEYISPSCEKLLGYTPGEMLGRSVFELVHPDDLQQVAGAFMRSRETLQPDAVQYRYRHAAGHYVWLETIGNPLFDQAGTGELIGAIFTTRDVTERVEAGEQLERSRELSSTVFEALPATLCLQASDYTIRYANRLFRDTFGDPEGRKCYEALHGRSEPCEDCLPLKVLEREEAARREVADERGRHFTVSYHPLKDEHGEKLVLEMGIDITERKRTTERLNKLNRCLLSLESDSRGNVEKILQVGQELLGAAALTYGVSGRGVFYTCDAEGIRVATLAPSAPEPPEPPPGSLSSKVMIGQEEAGRLSLEAGRARDLSEEEQELLVMLARAIGIEEERFRYQENLRDFIDVASHELRHPVTVMKGYAAMLRDRREAIDETTREVILDIIDHGADRLNRLVEGLLDISRIERGRFEVSRKEQPLTPLIERALEEIHMRGFNNEFRLEVSKDPGSRRVDGEKIVQLLVILLENAVKYSPSGEPVEVEVEAGEAGEVLITVKDRGIGVEEPDNERIFDRFYQVEEVLHHSTPGMGMGLYIARNIVEAHGGRIWVEPLEGGGSSFRFTLPE